MYESLSYDEAESDLSRARAHLSKAQRNKLNFRQGLLMFVLRILIGFVIGFTAWISTIVETQIVTSKFSVVRNLVREYRYFEGWVALMSYVVPLATLAALLTFWAPGAAGSGIPHVKVSA